MQLRLSGKLLRTLLMLFIFSNVQADWSGEAYGGRYYDDSRLGSYLVFSNASSQGMTVIAEALYEKYTDYEFAGIGGHFLWPVAQSVDVGFVVSQAWETFEFSGFDDVDYQTNTAGMELEFTGERVTLAAQSGKYLTTYDDTSSTYLSADLYFWSVENNWYLRGSTRWVSNDSLHLIEGYHTSYLLGLPFTAYLGAGVQNSIDSVYAGGYVELFSVPSSAMFLWSEVAEIDGETFLTIELSIVFGPGARVPYITAFGSSLN